jgi:hypothetical protein
MRRPFSSSSTPAHPRNTQELPGRVTLRDAQTFADKWQSDDRHYDPEIDLVIRENSEGIQHLEFLYGVSRIERQCVEAGQVCEVNELERYGAMGAFFPLFQSYEPKYYYMEVVQLAYRLVMSAVVVLFLPDTIAQVSEQGFMPVYRGPWLHGSIPRFCPSHGFDALGSRSCP